MARLAMRTYFPNLLDVRRDPRHQLLDVIGTAICAVIRVANDWQQIAKFWARERILLSALYLYPTQEEVPDSIEKEVLHQPFEATS